MLIFVSFYCFEQKGLFTTSTNFLLDFPLFKLVKKNKLSMYFWASFWDWFVQKQLFKQIQIQIFLLVCPFSNLWRKTNFLSISVLLSEIVTFLTKKRSFQWISPKCFKTTENHSLAVGSSLRGDKQSPFTCFFQKKLFTTNPNFSLDLPLFKLVKKNKLSEYFFASF